jgi:SAM-dependent methyltransferase
MKLIAKTLYNYVRRTGKIVRAERETRRRQAEWHSDAWEHKTAYSRRTTLGDYQTYRKTQIGKMEEMVAEGQTQRLERDLALFLNRFRSVPLPPHASVLCLGARLGSEVEAFIQLGHFAIGIDLHPGLSNSYVVTGDFHALQFADSSINGVYTNCLDHAYDLDKILAEVRRVLKSNGLFILDAFDGYEEGAMVGPRDTTHWPTAQAFAAMLAAQGSFVIERHSRPDPQWQQFLLRKA